METNKEDIKIACGDCLELMADIPDGSVDLVVTDPPYWHHKCPDKRYATRGCKTDHPFGSSELYSPNGKMYGKMSAFGPDRIAELLPELVRVCKIPNIYLFCNESQIPYYGKWADDHGLMFTILVWEKPLSIINKNRFSQNAEFIVRIYNYGTGLNRLDESAYYNRVDRTPPVQGNAKIHPTQKPTALVERFVRLSSRVGGLVLDPFAGSGTTAVACARTGRKCIAYELDPDFAQAARDRVAEELSFAKFYPDPDGQHADDPSLPVQSDLFQEAAQ